MINVEILNNALINVFTVIFTMSIEATVVAVIVILIKKVFAFKMNIRIGYLLWALVFIRLVFPVLPESPMSVLNYAGFDISSKISAWKDIALNQQAIKAPSAVDNSFAMNNYGSSSTDTHPSGIVPSGVVADGLQSHVDGSMSDADVQTDASYDRFQEPAVNILSMELSARSILLILSYLWVVGVILIVAYLITKNAVFSLHLKRMPDVTPSLDLSKAVDWIKSVTKVNRPVKFVEMEGIASPCVFGVVNYTIILPKGLLREMFGNNEAVDNMEDTGNASCVNNAEVNKKAVFHILAHEFAHIKHNDLAVSWLALLVCTVHWFNPMVWYCLRLLRREQELCADAYAMSLLDEEEFEQYGQTLLSVLKKGRKQPLSPVMAGIIEDKNALKQRIVNIATFTKNKYRLTLTGILVVLIAAVFLCTSRINYTNTGDVKFRPDDPFYWNIMEERGYKIVNQSLISHEVTFTPDMFPDEYVAAYKSEDIDWKIPLFTYENTTVYLKCIVESNESPDYLYAIFYFIHDVGRSPGNILTVGQVNFRDGVPDSYTPTGNVKHDVFSSSLKTIIEDAVSGRSIGPGCQMAIYLKKSVVEQTKGQFTVTLEGLNLVSYVPKSQYVPLDEQKKKRIRDMVYNRMVAGSKEELTGEEEIYAVVGCKGQKVVDPDSKTWVDVSGRYVYWVSFRTRLDGVLGPITALVDPKTEKIIGVFLRY